MTIELSTTNEPNLAICPHAIRALVQQLFEQTEIISHPLARFTSPNPSINNALIAFNAAVDNLVQRSEKQKQHAHCLMEKAHALLSDIEHLDSSLAFSLENSLVSSLAQYL
ncbi:hypothetical protein EML15_05960 [Corynebacterium sp. sy017]|uniref:hypothetical protein n=1 Tax=unclassified Corynebacterium TaxID=2624378 RepID=UPI001186B052|nr:MULTISPECIES: hypothetical protein [unclassified Corynebacterium]MBP3088693.1 hypothetical protein [Corynebacterium sp. sy017]QDZ42094.1 hypothetical protein FQV43_02080 [Corynebacterium sp. sy039]TSD91981.1 hypothetical protein ELY17_05960 [Corynebacterium sp. SY003]